MAKKPITIVVATNSLTNTQYEAYTNHIQFWFNLGRLRAYNHIKFALVNPARMSIDRMRNVAARTALEMNADYLLFVDDDVLVQKDALGKLIATKADIAAAKVVIRGYPFDWMLFKKRDNGLVALKELPDEGIEPVDAVGFSLCLIKVSLLKKIPTDNQPYFVTGVNNTEDIYFCIRARMAVPKCTIVCECSVNAGHILWPEVMDTSNRKAYKKYYETINPHILEQVAKDKKRKKNPRGDREEEYLNEVKEVTDGTAAA